MKPILKKWGKQKFKNQYMKYRYAYDKTMQLLSDSSNKFLKLFLKYNKLFNKFSPNKQLRSFDFMKIFSQYVINKQDPEYFLNLSFTKRFMQIKDQRQFTQMSNLINKLDQKLLIDFINRDKSYKSNIAIKVLTFLNKNNEFNENMAIDLRYVQQKIDQITNQFIKENSDIDYSNFTQQKLQFIEFDLKVQKLLRKKQQSNSKNLMLIDKIVQEYRPTIYAINFQLLNLNTMQHKKQNDEIIEHVKQDILKIKINQNTKFYSEIAKQQNSEQQKN